MLVTVKQSKLVLGRTTYRKGDIFECRDAEARLLLASHIVAKAAQGAKANKGEPKAPTVGVSKKVTEKAATVAPDDRVKRKERPMPSITKPAKAAATPTPAQTPAPAQPAATTPAPAASQSPAAPGNPVGGMTQPEPSAPSASPASAPATPTGRQGRTATTEPKA